MDAGVVEVGVVEVGVVDAVVVDTEGVAVELAVDGLAAKDGETSIPKTDSTTNVIAPNELCSWHAMTYSLLFKAI